VVEGGGGLFEEEHAVAFAVAFDGGGEAGETGADYEDGYAGGGDGVDGGCWVVSSYCTVVRPYSIAVVIMSMVELGPA
jgi:hypothetical protein